MGASTSQPLPSVGRLRKLIFLKIHAYTGGGPEARTFASKLRALGLDLDRIEAQHFGRAAQLLGFEHQRGVQVFEVIFGTGDGESPTNVPPNFRGLVGFLRDDLVADPNVQSTVARYLGRSDTSLLRSPGGDAALPGSPMRAWTTNSHAVAMPSTEEQARIPAPAVAAAAVPRGGADVGVGQTTRTTAEVAQAPQAATSQERVELRADAGFGQQQRPAAAVPDNMPAAAETESKEVDLNLTETATAVMAGG